MFKFHSSVSISFVIVLHLYWPISHSWENLLYPTILLLSRHIVVKFLCFYSSNFRKNFIFDMILIILTDISVNKIKEMFLLIFRIKLLFASLKLAERSWCEEFYFVSVLYFALNWKPVFMGCQSQNKKFKEKTFKSAILNWESTQSD